MITNCCIRTSETNEKIIREKIINLPKISSKITMYRSSPSDSLTFNSIIATSILKKLPLNNLSNTLYTNDDHNSMQMLQKAVNHLNKLNMFQFLGDLVVL